MVKRRQQAWVNWECEVCGRTHESKRSAEECEKKEPKKQKIGEIGKAQHLETDKWEIGDMMVIKPHDFGRHLAIIVKAEVVGHEIVPVFEYLGGEKVWTFHYDSDIKLLREQGQDQILKWARLIRRERAK